MRDRVQALLGPLAAALLFAASLWILHREFQNVHLRDVAAQWQSIPGRQLALAALFTALSYTALTGYDALAFRFLGQPLPYRKVALASFVAYVFGHNVGLSFFGGSAVRYRFYLAWGVPAAAIVQIVVFTTSMFWLGFVAMGGAALTFAPLSLPEGLPVPFATSRPLGIALLGLAALWGLASLLPLRAPRSRIALPGPRLWLAQLALASLDWLLAASALYALVPAVPDLDFGRFCGAYGLAVIVGLASHVPAGLGVFETALIVLLGPSVPRDALLGALVAYRGIYYLAPLGGAFALFAGFEASQRRPELSRAQSWLARIGPAVVPRLFALLALAAGVMLLFSGATPAVEGRLEALEPFVPLAVLEASHLLGSAIGVALLFLARALLQRIDAAYALALGLLASGIAASLLKGFDYEEAAVLAVMLLALLPCRSFFYRRSSLFAQPFAPSWTLGILGVLLATAFVTGLAYRDVAYSNELWWQFELSAAAPRSLRALVAGFGVVGCFGLSRLLGPAAPRVTAPSRALLEQIRPLVRAAPRTQAHLALLGDKNLLLNEPGSAFLMYGIEGNTWVAMGDPVGEPAERRDLAWRFRELADLHRGRAAFYEVGPADLPLYVDLGLSLHKLGEEARVPLAGFSLAGHARRGLRQSHGRAQREGATFEVLPAACVPPLLDELEVISDAWLAQKKTREKRFSLGFFDRDYLTQLPLAVVRRDGSIVAFANLWLAAHEELAPDLMRHDPKAPTGVMDYLFAELMLWGAAQGYGWLNLGMAPLAGLQGHRLARLWDRFGSFVFRHSEHFYGFQGLRFFKQKFDPVWEPRFLASPGGLALPIVLTHVAALISGGVKGVVSR